MLRSSLDGTGLEAIQLSIDQKPDHPDERNRIINAGGKVAPWKKRGPDRVWFNYEESLLGLAMSRSVGDALAHEVGVSCEPDIHNQTIQNNDHFVILGSDGLFDVIDNDQVAELTQIFLSREPQHPTNLEKIASFLATTARKRWESFGIENIDDITCVVIALNPIFDGRLLRATSEKYKSSKNGNQEN